MRRANLLYSIEPLPAFECQEPDCHEPAHARYLCSQHYTRWYRHQDPNVRLDGGRPASAHRERARQLLPAGSNRSQVRLAAALKLIDELHARGIDFHEQRFFTDAGVRVRALEQAAVEALRQASTSG